MTAGFSAVVVGNPKPASRTLHAARYVATELAGRAPDLVVDLAEVGAALLDWQSAVVGDLVERIAGADLVVVASPTFKATYSGLLKLFLDRFAAGQLTGVAVPLMLGAGPRHALAPGAASSSARLYRARTRNGVSAGARGAHPPVVRSHGRTAGS